MDFCRNLSSFQHFNSAHSESSYVALPTHCIITSYPPDHVSPNPFLPHLRSPRHDAPSLRTYSSTIVSGQTIGINTIPFNLELHSLNRVFNVTYLSMPLLSQSAKWKPHISQQICYSPCPAPCRHVSSTSTRDGFSSAAATRSLSFNCLLTMECYWYNRLDIAKPH